MAQYVVPYPSASSPGVSGGTPEDDACPSVCPLAGLGSASPPDQGNDELVARAVGAEVSARAIVDAAEASPPPRLPQQ